MPRYSSFQVKSAQTLQNSPPLSVSDKLEALNNKNYVALANDMRLSWDGDLKIDPSTGDYVISYNLEAFTQRLYRKLITQQGTYPGNSAFGWNFEYLFSLPLKEQENMLPYIAKDIKRSLEQDPEVSNVSDLVLRIVRDDFRSHKIEIEVSVIPSGYNNQVNIVLESVWENVMIYLIL